jgi:vancomycin permeability regulator SanA
MYRAKEVFGAEKIVVVTQEYHLYRALYVAQALGLDAVGVSADLRTYYGQSMRETRELAARVKDWLYTIIKPLPTYLGDPIDLTGDGSVTNG